jgi:hypothetical protein
MMIWLMIIWLIIIWLIMADNHLAYDRLADKH